MHCHGKLDKYTPYVGNIFKTFIVVLKIHKYSFGAKLWKWISYPTYLLILSQTEKYKVKYQILYFKNIILLHFYIKTYIADMLSTCNYNFCKIIIAVGPDEQRSQAEMQLKLL
jgi:hypothetical protein